MLLTTVEIANKLNARFAQAPFNASEFMLREPGASEIEMSEIETGLETELEASLRSTLLRYDLAPLTIGGVTLGSSDGIAAYILDNNVDPLTPWWGEGERPDNLILIGSSDGFALIADISTGRILAFHHGESVEGAKVVAQNLELFLRGIGTANLTQDGNTAVIVATEVGAESSLFWTEFAAGRT